MGDVKLNKLELTVDNRLEDIIKEIDAVETFTKSEYVLVRSLVRAAYGQGFCDVFNKPGLVEQFENLGYKFKKEIK